MITGDFGNGVEIWENFPSGGIEPTRYYDGNLGGFDFTPRYSDGMIRDFPPMSIDVSSLSYDSDFQKMNRDLKEKWDQQRINGPTVVELNGEYSKDEIERILKDWDNQSRRKMYTD